ncbi:MAG: hypothetical protein UH241_06610 [Acutalibacteraceae bacterium]|nr:hypothetical protein [Acutalibacteraceae bacterium]
MKLTIKGTPKEIADLVVAIQGQQHITTISIDTSNRNTDNLVIKNNQERK